MVAAAGLVWCGCSGVAGVAGAIAADAGSGLDIGKPVADASPADALAGDATSRDATIDASVAAEDAPEEPADDSSVETGLPDGPDEDSSGDSIDDISNYTQISGVGPRLDDGAAHDVLVQRRSGTLYVYVDGNLTGTSGSEEALTNLTPVSAGVDVCDGQDGTASLAGSITQVCVNNP
jgi:hypothetical protein